jgi:hypothetical protein
MSLDFSTLSTRARNVLLAEDLASYHMIQVALRLKLFATAPNCGPKTVAEIDAWIQLQPEPRLFSIADIMAEDLEVLTSERIELQRQIRVTDDLIHAGLKRFARRVM